MGCPTDVLLGWGLTPQSSMGLDSFRVDGLPDVGWPYFSSSFFVLCFFLQLTMGLDVVWAVGFPSGPFFWNSLL